MIRPVCTSVLQGKSFSDEIVRQIKMRQEAAKRKLAEGPAWRRSAGQDGSDEGSDGEGRAARPGGASQAAAGAGASGAAGPESYGRQAGASSAAAAAGGRGSSGGGRAEEVVSREDLEDEEAERSRQLQRTKQRKKPIFI